MHLPNDSTGVQYAVEEEDELKQSVESVLKSAGRTGVEHQMGVELVN